MPSRKPSPDTLADYWSEIKASGLSVLSDRALEYLYGVMAQCWKSAYEHGRQAGMREAREERMQ